MASKQKVIIFGAGLGGKRAARFLRKRYEVVGFADNSKEKHGTRFMGKLIIAPEELAGQDVDLIIIASMYAYDIFGQLQKLGIDMRRVEVVDHAVLGGDYDFPWTCAGILAGLAVLVVVLAYWLVIA